MKALYLAEQMNFAVRYADTNKSTKEKSLVYKFRQS